MAVVVGLSMLGHLTADHGVLASVAYVTAAGPGAGAVVAVPTQNADCASDGNGGKGGNGGWFGSR
ncbi:MAG: hypothetical protein M3Z25_10205 [Actinomycetota bacterium]|nr:hypothetical protein [Actinomycetota bacterium]